MITKTKMKTYLDLHIHGPYSRATSDSITLELIARQASYLGIGVIGTGDCLQSDWYNIIKKELRYDKETEMLYHPVYPDVKFILTTEINCVWEKKQAHFLLVFPTSREIINHVVRLGNYGNLDNGRPSLAIHPKELQEAMKNVSEDYTNDILFIPAHVLTPYYGILGSRNAFLSLWETFSPRFPPDALETGLSASAEMCWQIEEIRNIPCVSFSDAHSINSIGREVTVIDNNMEFNLSNIFKCIKEGHLSTREYPPQLGKYYWDGHRKCEAYLEPIKWQIDMGGYSRCLVCNKHLTKGVLHRVYELQKGEEEAPWKDKYIIPRKGKIDDRIGTLEGLEFQYGYDGKFGEIIK